MDTNKKQIIQPLPLKKKNHHRSPTKKKSQSLSPTPQKNNLNYLKNQHPLPTKKINLHNLHKLEKFHKTVHAL